MGRNAFRRGQRRLNRMVSSDRIDELRGEAQTLDAKLQVGKSGLSEGFLSELEKTLRREGLVKVKLLRSARAGEDVEEMAEELSDETGSVLVETRGNTVVLYHPAGDR